MSSCFHINNLRNSKAKSILILNTGGTFSCRKLKNGKLAPQKEFVEDWIKQHFRRGQQNERDEFKEDTSIQIRYKELKEFFDSSKCDSSTWELVCKDLHRFYAEFFKAEHVLGCIVIHGTDTLAYTASAVSFACPVPCPIILTGSMYPLEAINSDAPSNLYGAYRCLVELDSSCAYSSFVFFNCHLLRANRVRKAHANSVDAFQSVNSIPVAKVEGTQVLLDLQYVKHRNKRNRLKINKQFNTERKFFFSNEVALVRIYPGFDLSILAHLNKKVVILQAYGAGNADSAIIDFISKHKDTLYFACTECYNGKAESEYDVDISSTNCVNLLDITPEAAFTKASYLLAGPDMGKNYANICQKKLIDAIYKTLRTYLHYGDEREECSAKVLEFFKAKYDTMLKRSVENNGSMKLEPGEYNFANIVWEDLGHCSCDLLLVHLKKLKDFRKTLLELFDYIKVIDFTTFMPKQIKMIFCGDKEIKTKKFVEKVNKGIRFTREQEFQIQMLFNRAGEILNEESRKAKTAFLYGSLFK